LAPRHASGFSCEKLHSRSLSPSGNGATISSLIDDLLAEGRYHLTTDEARRRLGGSVQAARAVLRRQAAHGRIAQPFKGFWVVVPPEYRALGCLPPEQFIPQLFEHLGAPYYVGLLSAAQRLGAAHQQPQAFQVVIERARPAIECGQVRVEFVARKSIRDVPVDVINTPRGAMRVSTAEATAFDVVGYPGHVGGLDGAATVVAELLEKLDAERLLECAATAPLPWVQRLGFILDLVGGVDVANFLAEFVIANVRDATRLSPGTKRKGKRDERWKLDVNAALEPDVEALA
jgi:predicted transcriptional regulator of viral defense system